MGDGRIFIPEADGAFYVGHNQAALLMKVTRKTN
jgi:hypothetical protein